MRILIVEDELLERKAMKKFIEDHFSDMTIVGEAANGRMAIELAASRNPDVIFMDIKMPGINGLDAIREIRKTNEQVKFILVSAYDSFDYAKEAMQYGIKDYILKPGRKEEIVKALLRTKKELAEDREQEERSLELLRVQFISKAMENSEAKELEELQKRLFPRMEGGSFIVMTSSVPVQIKELSALLQSASPFPFIIQESDERVIVCLIADTEIEKADLLTLAKKVIVQLEDAVYIGIGLPVSSCKKLSKSYEQAYVTCLQLAADGKSKFGFPQKSQAVHAEEVTVELLRLVEKGEGNQVISLFKQHEADFSEPILEELYIKLKNIFLQRGIELQGIAYSQLRSSKDWHRFLLLCCANMQQFHQSKQHMEQAKRYVAEHYREPLTLGDVAATVNLSSNYFSNLFKKEFGETFIDYVTRVRMEKAKELIESNQYNLKEISFMVGYNNPNYFSRVFKKHFHESPKQFQKSIFK